MIVFKFWIDEEKHNVIIFETIEGALAEAELELREGDSGVHIERAEMSEGAFAKLEEHKGW